MGPPHRRFKGMDLRVQKGHRFVSILHPRMQGETWAILLIFYWRPRRDLNPCYRRESASERILATLTNTLSAPQLSAKKIYQILYLTHFERLPSSQHVPSTGCPWKPVRNPHLQIWEGLI